MLCRADPRATWPATFLCWLKQEAGLGRVLLEELGLETVVRINRPVRPGDELAVRVAPGRRALTRPDALAPCPRHRLGSVLPPRAVTAATMYQMMMLAHTYTAAVFFCLPPATLYNVASVLPVIAITSPQSPALRCCTAFLALLLHAPSQSCSSVASYTLPATVKFDR